jgi:Lon protease-like protein
VNLTVDQFLTGLERTTREMPSALHEWKSLDRDLRDEYTDQLEWMVDAIDEVLPLAAKTNRAGEAALRVAVALASLRSMRDEILAVIGVDVGRLPNDGTTFTVTFAYGPPTRTPTAA